MARVAKAGFAISLGLALGIGIEPAQATEQPRELEASLVVDLDDDDADGREDGLQDRVGDAVDCATWDVAKLPSGMSLEGVTPAGAVRVLADGVPIAAGQRVPPGAARLQVQALRPGPFSVELGSVRVRGSALRLLALDGNGRSVSFAASHASIQRTIPDRVDAPDAVTRDPDALRFVVAGVAGDLPAALAVRARGETGVQLSALDALRLADTTCPVDAGAGVVCRTTMPVRVVGDEADRVHPLVVDRSVTGELGGGILIDLGGGRRQQIRVGGPRETKFGAMRRYRATLRTRLLRLGARGAAPLGGTDAKALKLMRGQVALANALWSQCGISLGPPADADIALVDPPPPWLVSVGCELGLPASGGQVRLVVDGRPLTVAVEAGWSPARAAREIATSLEKRRYRVGVSTNARIGPGAMATVDLQVWRGPGRAAEVKGPDAGSVSTDRTLGVCVGTADLSVGLRHFLDVDSMAGTFDERTLLKWVDDRDPSTIDLMVVSSFVRGGRIGESFIGTDRSSVRNAVVLDRSGIRVARASYALAHEVGHVMLDVPGHPDDYGRDTPTLLMDSDGADASVFGPRRLRVEDCERAMQNSGPGSPVPLLREWRWGRLGKP